MWCLSWVYSLSRFWTSSVCCSLAVSSKFYKLEFASIRYLSWFLYFLISTSYLKMKFEIYCSFYLFMVRIMLSKAIFCSEIWIFLSWLTCSSSWRIRLSCSFKWLSVILAESLSVLSSTFIWSRRASHSLSFNWRALSSESFLVMTLSIRCLFC